MESPCRTTRCSTSGSSTIKEGIEAQFGDDPNVFVAGDLLWYPVEGNNTIRTAPDVLVAFGRPKGNRGSYKQWEEGGIAPQVVFEVLSPGNRPGEMKRKFQFYQRYGVEEYYIYDPGQRLTSKAGVAGGIRLEKIARMAGFVSPRLGIRFEPGEGPDNLTIIGRNGQPFITPLEMSRQLEAERSTERRAARLRPRRRPADTAH